MRQGFGGILLMERRCVKVIANFLNKDAVDSALIEASKTGFGCQYKNSMIFTVIVTKLIN